MSAHANCTHEKTKAARALCRAGAASGRTHDEQRKLTIQDNATKSRRAIIAEKRARLADKLGEPKAQSGDAAYRPEVMSAFCGNGSHDRCPGGGTQWTCQCDCHASHAE